VQETDSVEKTVLIVVLIISAGLLLYPQINSYSKISDNKTIDAKNQLAEQIFGFFLLFFVVFCVIWAIPETEEHTHGLSPQPKPTAETDQFWVCPKCHHKNTMATIRCSQCDFFRGADRPNKL